MAKKVFPEMMETGKSPEQIVEERGLKQVSDTSAIETFVDQAIAANAKAVEDYKKGNMKAVGALVGLRHESIKGPGQPGDG